MRVKMKSKMATKMGYCFTVSDPIETAKAKNIIFRCLTVHNIDKAADTMKNERCVNMCAICVPCDDLL